MVFLSLQLTIANHPRPALIFLALLLAFDFLRDALHKRYLLLRQSIRRVSSIVIHLKPTFRKILTPAAVVGCIAGQHPGLQRAGAGAGCTLGAPPKANQPFQKIEECFRVGGRSGTVVIISHPIDEKPFCTTLPGGSIAAASPADIAAEKHLPGLGSPSKSTNDLLHNPRSFSPAPTAEGLTS